MAHCRVIACACACAAMAAAAEAQEPSVELQVSARTLELGEAVSARLVCTNTGTPEPPQAVMPEGLDLRLLNPSPSQSSFTQIVNGRMSQRSTYTYPMQLIALKVGTYTLGPISVVANGKTYQTRPVQIVVRDTQTTTVPKGDRYVFAEIDVQPQSLYITETYRARLRVGVRKVKMDRRVFEMNWRQAMEGGGTQFSVFRDGDWKRSTTSLPDSTGARNTFDIYESTVEVAADEVGEQFVGPAFVKIDYPTAVRRDLWRGYKVTQSRREIARADAVPITVKAPPEEGRPADYKGAIGRFALSVDAKPERVEQGQPVTLTIRIEGAPLEGVAGPDLTKQPELVSRFDFTTDELVGDLERGAKVFRRAVFPRQVGEQTIPAVSWSFFDVEQERYVMLTSDPILITVDPPTATTTAIVVPNANGVEPAGITLTALTGGISPNFADAEAALADQTFAFSAPWIAVLFVSPVVWLITTMATRHRARIRSDRGLARRRRARRRAEARIERVMRRNEAALQLCGLAEAMTGYLADRYGLPPGTLTPDEARPLLARTGIDETTADTITDFLEACDAVRYAPGTRGAMSPSEAAATVRRWIRQLEGSLL